MEYFKRKSLMRKILSFLLVITSLFVLTACSTNNGTTSTDAKSTVSQSNAADSKQITKHSILIIYYSYSGQTDRVAKLMQELTGGDIYKIQSVNDYPDDPHKTAEISMEERRTGNLPKIKDENNLPNLSNYDLILIGGPVWNSHLATPLMRYLELTNFGGKKVAPFWTSVGSTGSYESDFSEQAKNAIILKGLSIEDVKSKTDSELSDMLNSWPAKIN